MLNLTSQSRRWIVLAAVLWLVILAGIIFIPQSRSDEVAQVAPTNSLTRSLQQTRPGGDAVSAQLVDPARIYDPERYVGYTTLGPGEPQELVDAKLEAFGISADDLDLGGDLGYFICKTQVDLAIGVPPIAVIGGGDDEIVVERPQRGIGKALVEGLKVGLGQPDRVQ